MATVSKWTPFGVALDITATGSTVTRTSATQYTVKINASWETYYSGAQTNYGMTAASGGVTSTISAFNGTKRSSGSSSFTGTYSISGNGSATKTITVTFRNFNTDNGDSATKNVTFNVTVPAWTSYTITYNANGGSGAPSSQTKWKDQTLTLSSTKPTRTGYSFLGWSTSSSATTATYSAGGSYTANAAATLYAVWKADTYTVKYNANGGTGAPGDQTKTYGQTLTLSSTIPTRTNYNFLGWATSASATTATYSAGGSYTANAAITLYAVWELAYTKPRIDGLSVVRCDSTGAESDEGTNALVTFNWATDREVTEIKMEWESASYGTASTTLTATGTSGSVSEIIGSDSLSTDSVYTIRVFVTDSIDSTKLVTTLNGTLFGIDVMAGCKGVSVGKPAELEGVFDVNFAVEARHGFICIPLETDTDLNNVMEPNTYVSVNKSADTYLNTPVSSGTFVLEVMSAGAEGQVFQRLTTTFKGTHERYERHYYQSSWGDWFLVQNDTGWLDLTLYSGYTVGSEHGFLMGRRKNGVLYLKGDVLGITANWAKIASLPSALVGAGLSTNRFGAVYNMTNFCGMTLTNDGQLYVTSNSTGAWSATLAVSINAAICL